MKNTLFKYQEIVLALEKRIAAGEFNDGRALPHEGELAKEYGVNHLTLRKAMDILVHNGHVRRYPGKGTFVVDPNEKEIEKEILYVGETESHFFKDLYFSIMKYAQGFGRRLFAIDTSEGCGYSEENLKRAFNRAASVICRRSYLANIMALAKQNNKTIVVADSYDEGEETLFAYCSVSTNLFLAGYQATRHLLSLGHRKIALIGTPDNSMSKNLYVPAPWRRTSQGYSAAYSSMKLPPPQGLQLGIIEANVEEQNKYIARWLRGLSEQPSAFVCDTDYRGVELMRAIQEQGLHAPKDFSIIGIGNTPWTQMTTPQLTSIDMQEAEIARTAVLLAMQPPPKENLILQISPRLVIRESVVEQKNYSEPPAEVD